MLGVASQVHWSSSQLVSALRRTSLLVILFIDVEVPKFVRSFAGRNNPQEITQLLFLQIFLRQVLQIALRKWRFCTDVDLRLVARDLNFLTEIPRLTVNFDTLLQELLQVFWLDDRVIGWLLAVHSKFEHPLLALHHGFLFQALNNHVA